MVRNRPRITELPASLSHLPPPCKRGNFGRGAVQILVRFETPCDDRATISANSGIVALIWWDALSLSAQGSSLLYGVDWGWSRKAIDWKRVVVVTSVSVSVDRGGRRIIK